MTEKKIKKKKKKEASGRHLDFHLHCLLNYILILRPYYGSANVTVSAERLYLVNGCTPQAWLTQR